MADGRVDIQAKEGRAPAPVQAVHLPASGKTRTGSPFERFCGMLAVTMFSSCFYYSTLYPLCVCALLAVKGVTWANAAWFLPCILSILLPSVPLPRVLALPFFKCILKYHDFEEVLETTDEEVEEMFKKRNFIFACQPHGVMSIAGVCYAVSRAPNTIPPTAVASVLLRIPLMKHVFGSFGLIDASKRSLTKALKKQSVVIYVGGMAELFLSTPSEERLYIAKRTGFIKLAMQTGADVIPAYFFGNTTTLEVIRGRALMAVSRALGVSLTLFWGRWFLAVPLPRKVLCVRGRPLDLPVIAEPTNEQVLEYHAKYVAEVKRLFDKYKEKAGPDYANKTLILDVDE